MAGSLEIHRCPVPGIKGAAQIHRKAHGSSHRGHLHLTRSSKQAIIIVDHGSRRAESNQQLEDFVALYRYSKPLLQTMSFVWHYKQMLTHFLRLQSFLNESQSIKSLPKYSLLLLFYLGSASTSGTSRIWLAAMLDLTRDHKRFAKALQEAARHRDGHSRPHGDC